MLFRKYIGPDGGFHNTIIVDANKNQIRYVDDVFLNLIYLSGNENLKKIIEHSSRLHSDNNATAPVHYAELYSFL